MLQAARLSKGQIEDQIGKEIIRFCLKYLGHGPREIKTYIIEDIVVVRIIDDLRSFEKALLVGNQDVDIETIKEIYRRMWERYIGELSKIIKQNTGSEIICSHHDISTKTDERVEVFILDSKF